MAFPTVQASIGQTFNATGATKAVPLPATVNAGELLVVVFITDRRPSLAIPAGWRRVSVPAQDWNPSDSVRALVIYKVADGSEGGTTINIVQGAADEAISYAYAISGYELPLYLGRAAFSGGTANPNPPPWFSFNDNDSLWVAILGVGSGNTASAFPTNYGLSQATNASGGAGGCAAAIAMRQLRASWEAAGTFTITSAVCVTGILLIRSPD